MTSVEGEVSFWSLAQRLQAEGHLCDVRLVVNSPDDAEANGVIHAHKLVLVWASQLFRSALEAGDLLDAYNFVGISRDNLQIVVDYMYRRCTLNDVKENTEAAFAAQAIQVITDWAEREGELGGELEGKPFQKEGTQILVEENVEEIVADNAGDTGEEINCEETEADADGEKEKEIVVKICTKEVQSKQGKGSPTRTKKTDSIINENKCEQSLRSTEGTKDDSGQGTKHTSNPIKLSENSPDSPREQPESCASDLGEKPESVASNDSSDNALRVNPALLTKVTQSLNPVVKLRQLPTIIRNFPPKPIPESSSQTQSVPVSSSQSVAATPKPSPKTPKVTSSVKSRPIPKPEGTSTSEPAPILGRSSSGRRRKTINYRLMAEGPTFKVEEEEEEKEEEVSSDSEQEELSPIDKKRTLDEIDPDFRAPRVDMKRVRRAVKAIDFPLGSRHPEGSTPEKECDPSKVDEDKKPSQASTEPNPAGVSSKKVGSADVSSKKVASKKVDDVQFKCKDCPRVFTKKSSLTLHGKAVHGTHSKFTCEICDMVFRSLRKLDKHRSDAHGLLQPHCCSTCGLTFKTREGLKVHVTKKHTDERPLFECTLCNKTFYVRGELNTHMKYHAKERAHQCDQCPRAFKSKSLMIRHIKTFHSTARDFQCDVCEATFKTRNDCKAHRIKHFREKNPIAQGFGRGKRFPDGEQYKCNFCDRVFEKRTQQKVHERLQHKQRRDGTSYLCTVCAKVFPIKHYLLQHIKNTHSQRIHACQNCTQSFAQASDLRRHQTQPGRCKGSVVEPKPFSCPRCNRGFSLKGNLAKHLQHPTRCSGRTRSHPDVIVVVQQNEGEGAKGEGLPVEGLVARQAAEGLVEVQELGITETQELGGTTIQVSENAIADYQMLQQTADGNVTLQGLVDGKLVPLTVTTVNGQVQFTIQDQNGEMVQYATGEEDQLQGQAQGQGQGQVQVQGQDQGQGQIQEGFEVVQNVVTEDVNESVIQLFNGNMNGAESTDLQVLQIQSVIDGHQLITQGYPEVTVDEHNEGQIEVVYDTIIESDRPVTEETVPELAMQVADGQIVLEQQEVISDEVVDQGQELVCQGRKVVFQGQEVINQGQQIVGQGQQMVVQGQGVVYQGQEVVFHNQEVVSQGQEAVSQGQEVVYQSQDVVYQGQDMVYQGQEVVYQTQDMVSQGQEEVSQGQEVVYQIQEEISQGQEVVYEGQEVVYQGQEEVSQGQEVVYQGQEEVSQGQEVGGELTEMDEQVIQIQNVVYMDQADEMEQSQSLIVD